MPYRRRARRKPRRRYKRKWGRRSKFRKNTRWGKSIYNIHKYRRMGRTTTMPLLATATNGETMGALNFTLADVVNSSELTVLYDQFRIDFVTCNINWSPKDANPTAFNTGPNQMAFPVMYYAKDYDDIVPPISLTAFKERGNLKSFRLMPFRTHKISLKPAVQNAIIRDPSVVPPTLSTNPVWNKKLDCAAANIPHFGLKLLCDHITGQNLGTINIQITYHVTMFGTR